MLPALDSPKFPDALFQRRAKLEISRRQLADTVGIVPKMIRLYEDTTAVRHTRPKIKVWVALNIALGYNISERYQEELLGAAVVSKDLVFHNEKDLTIIECKKQAIKEMPIQYFTLWQSSSPYYNHAHNCTSIKAH